MLKLGHLPGQSIISNAAYLALRIKNYPYKNKRDISDDPLDISPLFQRGAVWTRDQQIQFIKSLFEGFPMPAIFTNQYPNGGEVVIDGKQRLLAIAAFLNDEIEIDGERWSQQDEKFRRSIQLTCALPHIVCRFATERECIELYVRLLRTGTAHTEEEIQKAEALLNEN